MAQALLLARPQRLRSKQHIAIVLAAAACVLVAVTLHLTNTTARRDSTSISQTSATSSKPLQSTNGVSIASPSDIKRKPDVILLAAERVRGEQQAASYQIHRDASIQLQIMLSGETARSGYGLQKLSC